MREYIAIDLEMTGLHPKTDAILEIGAVHMKNGQVQETLNLMVNPRVLLSEKIIELTGITQEMADEGIDVGEAILTTIDFIGDRPLVGHNISFDYSFIKQAAVNHGKKISYKSVDTLKVARKLLLPSQKKTLDALCELYGIPLVHHRAYQDAWGNAQLYERMYAIYGEKYAEEFVAKEMQCRVKKQTPATPVQKKHLKELIDYHKIDSNFDWDTLTRSEASRKIDQYLQQYGRVKRG